MKFLFIVQGEGRGHMTQALAMHDILTKKGHEVCAVVLGSSKRREAPAYFKDQIKCPIYPIPSPNFITDKNNKAIRMWPTITQNLRMTKVFRESLEKINKIMTTNHPDVILNFYDILGGLYNFFYQPKAKFIVVGHQYLVYHPAFPFAKGAFLQKTLFLLNTHITALGADKRIALSFWQGEMKNSLKMAIWPPLLRSKIKNLDTKVDPFFLVYLVNSGYGNEILETAKRNPTINMVAFWDAREMPETYQPLPNLIFHQVNDQLFLEKMASCQGLMTTAGFESVCEAMYLGKKVMMVPVKGHYEQMCNAIDAENAKAGRSSTHFDLKLLVEYIQQIPKELKEDESFKIWHNSLEEKIDDLLEDLLKSLSPADILEPAHYPH